MTLPRCRAGSVQDELCYAIHGPIDEVDDNVRASAPPREEHSPHPEVRIEVTQPLVAIPSRHDLRDRPCLGEDLPLLRVRYSVARSVQSLVPGNPIGRRGRGLGRLGWLEPASVGRMDGDLNESGLVDKNGADEAPMQLTLVELVPSDVDIGRIVA